MFTKTAKQLEATDLMSAYMFLMLFGGSRSGKTFIIIRNTLTRALAKKSRHLSLRKTFSSIKRSIWHETLPDVLSVCYPELKEGKHYVLNKTELFLEFFNGSSYWLGGLDDKERMDKILGTQYSTIHLNECSELNFAHVETVKTRLAEKSGLPLKLWLDQNPPSKKHWSYKLFYKGINPADNKPLSAQQLSGYSKMLMNPVDNTENLPKTYFNILDGLGARQRARFRDGLFSSDVEGALWSNEMINEAQLLPSESWIENPLQTIVALDPNVSSGANKQTGEFKSDEAGIIVCSKDRKGNGPEGRGLIEADYSGAYSTKEWAKKAVWAYHQHDADCIVAEVNQGGQLVKDVLRAEDSTVKVVMVHASKGKFARAEPVTVLYENRQIKHSPGMGKLEDELLDYVPGVSSESPNRLDAAVWGNTYLFLGKKQKISSVRVRY